MKDYGAPRWSAEILDCSMPMTFDTYNKCSFNCLYCFAWFQKSHSLGAGGTREGKHNYQATPIAAVKPSRIKKLFTGESKSQFAWYIAERRVMQWGGMSDPFDEYERKHGVTLDLLRFFKEINYPLCFSTKGVWWTEDPRYVELFRGQKNWNVKISVLNLDPRRAKAMEGGVAPPTERLKAMARIASWDSGGVTLRLRPFIIGLSDRNQEHLELIRRASDAGATAMSTEFFCLERRADARLRERYDRMSNLCGFDVLDFYVRNSRGSGYLRLNRALKTPYIEAMQDLCATLKLRFYVSDAHWKEACHNGSCCGLDRDWNYSKGQFTEALLIAKERGSVSFSDIEPHIQPFKKILWGRAQGFNSNSVKTRARRMTMTLFDFFRSTWNQPNDAKSPYRYFGGALRPDRVDESGNVVYVYQGGRKLPTVQGKK